jgi:hypothetical protein
MEEKKMASKVLTPQELVDTHKPKHFKFKYIFTDESLLAELMNSDYDITTLDTICDDKLVEAALAAECKVYERTIVGKAKEPTFLDNGIIVSKKMVTKADKKLLNVQIGFFSYITRHCVIKLHYERFDIIEIFNLI